MTESADFEKLKNILVQQRRHDEDIEKIEEAFLFASELHKGQFRRSEEPYIIHPLEVAIILADLELDTHTIIAAFLHDAIEDTDIEPEKISEKFGPDVLNLVQGVTKLGKYQFQSKEERQAENFRRMFVAMANDIRIIFLKLADRLHNMRTLKYMSVEKQKRIAQETLDIFAPLANRLGIGRIKAELEDLSLRYLYPEKYFEIAQLVSLKRTEREQTVKLLIEKITDVLHKNGINAQIQGRAKHYYSIYKKMQRLNIAFHDLYDITAVRVIVDDIRECYEVLGIIHSQFKPIPGRFKDYIAMPKSNMYRSLHTSVIGPRSKPLEVQIRTFEMHEVAEFGVAAHWRYKEKGVEKATSQSDLQFSFMKKMVEMNKETKSANEYVERVKLDIFSDQVFAFTPAGDVIDLPANATPVDFAFRIHTDVGYRISGALVNGRIAQLDKKLKNGDIIEILTTKNPAPRLDWLNFVVTKQAQSKIKHWFKKHNKENHVAMGTNLLEIELTKAFFDEVYSNGELAKVASLMNYNSVDDMLAALGYGETTAQKISNKLKKPKSEDEDAKIALSQEKKKHTGDVIGLEGMLYSFAKCCTPVPGEPIVGVVTRSKGVSIHRTDCDSLTQIPPERLMKIDWADDKLNKNYVSSIKIDVQDKIGILKEILSNVTDSHANIIYANVKSQPAKHLGVIELGVEIDNIDTLTRMIDNLKSIPEVYSVKRVPAINKNKQHSLLNSKKSDKIKKTFSSQKDKKHV